MYVSACAFFYSEILLNVYLKNMVFDLTVPRIFHGKNGPDLLPKNNNSERSNFHDR
jgi:hypothetical protein